MCTSLPGLTGFCVDQSECTLESCDDLSSTDLLLLLNNLVNLLLFANCTRGIYESVRERKDVVYGVARRT